MRKILLAGAAAGALALAALGMAAPASAGTHPAASKRSMKVAGACSELHLKAAYPGVRVRKDKNLNGTILAEIPKDGPVTCLQDWMRGGSYTDCGGGSSWTQVDYQPTSGPAKGRTVRGWSASLCLTVAD